MKERNFGLVILRAAIDEIMPHTLENVLKIPVDRIGYMKLSRKVHRGENVSHRWPEGLC